MGRTCHNVACFSLGLRPASLLGSDIVAVVAWLKSCAVTGIKCVNDLIYCFNRLTFTHLAYSPAWI